MECCKASFARAYVQLALPLLRERGSLRWPVEKRPRGGLECMRPAGPAREKEVRNLGFGCSPLQTELAQRQKAVEVAVSTSWSGHV